MKLKLSRLSAAILGHLTSAGILMRIDPPAPPPPPGSSPAPTPPPVISAEVQAIIDAAVGREVHGLRTKNGELIGKLKEKDNVISQFDGIDPVAMKSLLAKFDTDEEKALAAKGDIDGVVNKRTERMKTDYEKKVDLERKEKERYITSNQKLADRAVKSEIISAASKAGALTEALEDIVLRAKGVWKVNEDGDVVAMNGDEVALGKDGKTPLTPIEWAETLRETAPHLWPKAQGSNAPGSGVAGKAGVDYSNLSPAERMTRARAAGVTR